jgi:NAD(P)-dependent dehydrogenase (short-subunit alcohol dehydrogenase family)
VPVRLDVLSHEQIDEAADRLQDVDLLVCNAGVTCQVGVVAATDEAAFRDTMEVNFFANLHLVRAFAPTLRRRQGGIVFVISVAAVGLSRSAPIYSASKAAELMLALGVREELKGDGVTVTVSLPGFIATDMSATMTSPKASARQVAERTLDGWAEGERTVWPDRFAELVRDAIGEPMQRLIDAPGAVMTSVISAFGSDPAAGL